MRLTITDDEGVVFATHTLDQAAQEALVRLFEQESSPEAIEAEAKAQAVLDDIYAGMRNDGI